MLLSMQDAIWYMCQCKMQYVILTLDVPMKDAMHHLAILTLAVPDMLYAILTLAGLCAWLEMQYAISLIHISWCYMLY